MVIMKAKRLLLRFIIVCIYADNAPLFASRQTTSITPSTLVCHSSWHEYHSSIPLAACNQTFGWSCNHHFITREKQKKITGITALTSQSSEIMLATILSRYLILVGKKASNFYKVLLIQLICYRQRLSAIHP